MIKINLDRINVYSFEGTINAHDLTEEQLERLELTKLELDQEHEVPLRIHGNFHIEWDEEIPMPRVEYLVVEYNNSYLDLPYNNYLDLPLENVDIEKLEHEIEMSGHDCDWLLDKRSSESDFYD